MAWFRSNKNGGHNTDHNKPKPGELGGFDHIHHPVIIDYNGMKHPIVGYEAERHNSEQYMSKTEKVVKYRRFPGMADERYSPSKMEEYGTGNLSGRNDEVSHKFHDERRGPIKDSTWDNGFRINNPPSTDHHHITRGKPDNLNFDTNYTDDDHDNTHVRVNNTTKGTKPNNSKEQEYYNDEMTKRNGFTKEGSRPNHLKDQEYYYENVNPKTNGYSPPTYTVPVSTHQDKEKGNDYATRARMGPFETTPRNESSYETSNFKPMANSPPQFNPHPKKEQGNYNQETIDSNEARRRYGNTSFGTGSGLYAEDKHSGGAIDSKEAARKYNGVLLTN